MTDDQHRAKYQYIVNLFAEFATMFANNIMEMRKIVQLLYFLQFDIINLVTYFIF